MSAVIRTTTGDSVRAAALNSGPPMVSLEARAGLTLVDIELRPDEARTLARQLLAEADGAEGLR